MRLTEVQQPNSAATWSCVMSWRRELGVERPVGRRVGADDLDRAAEDAALGVQLFRGHADHGGEAAFHVRHGARGGEEAAELDGVGGAGAADQAGRGEARGREAESGGAGAPEQAAAGQACGHVSLHLLVPVLPRGVVGFRLLPLPK